MISTKYFTIPGAKKSYRKPSPAARAKAINEAIEAAKAILKSKLQMLRQNDPATLELFTRWFGKCNSRSKHTILERIRKQLAMLQQLTLYNFYEITHLNYRRNAYFVVYPDDRANKIALGHPFWKAPHTGVHSKAGKLIQALSHFHKAGLLKGYAFGDKGCLALVASARDKAFGNAENFARFLES